SYLKNIYFVVYIQMLKMNTLLMESFQYPNMVTGNSFTLQDKRYSGRIWRDSLCRDISSRLLKRNLRYTKLVHCCIIQFKLHQTFCKKIVCIYYIMIRCIF